MSSLREAHDQCSRLLDVHEVPADNEVGRHLLTDDAPVLRIRRSRIEEGQSTAILEDYVPLSVGFDRHSVLREPDLPP